MSFAAYSIVVAVLTEDRIAGDAPNGWKTSYVLVLLILGVLLIGSFIAWENFCECPLMPLHIWKDRNFTLVSARSNTARLPTDGATDKRRGDIRLYELHNKFLLAISLHAKCTWVLSTLRSRASPSSGDWWNHRQRYCRTCLT